MKLNRMSSQDVVNELVKTFGDEKVLSLLGITEKRLKTLLIGRGCLADAQLSLIDKETGRSWMRWGVEGGARYAKTPKARELVAATYELLDRIDPQPKQASPANARNRSMVRRTKAGTFRQAVRS